MHSERNNLTNAFETEILHRSRQRAEKGYSGTGFNWAAMPAYVAGLSSFANSAIQPGSDVNAVEDTSFDKVGGGIFQAQIPDYGGTAAYGY